MNTQTRVGVALLTALATATAIAVVANGSIGSSALADSRVTPDQARGLVFDGLSPADGGACAGGFEIDALGETLCTHGPDVSPEGIDVREPRSVAKLRLDTLSLPSVARPGLTSETAAAESATAAQNTSAEGIVPVIGDGVSGPRFQAVYAVAADQPDRYDEVAPLIANWAAYVNSQMNESAALTGGERHIRYVTNPDGSLDVDKVILPIDGDDTFGNLIVAMQSMGYTQPDRKYVIWTDASVYCGIATLYRDDKPTPDNNNNGRFATYSRIDTACWGRSNSVELHEMVHSMGGVQPSAPHSTPGLHCSDDYDRMCYRDAVEVTMTYNCEVWMEAYLDCGHDDYFHTSPAPGSYLDTHWNVANSSFLHAGPVGGNPPPPPPPPPNEAPTVIAAAPNDTDVGVAVPLNGSVSDDGLPGPYTVTWAQDAGPAQANIADTATEDTLASFPAPGTYRLTLTADDGELTGSSTVTVVVNEPEPPPPPPNEAPTVSIDGPATVELGQTAQLDGTVADDGQPGPVGVTWTQAVGPAPADFGSPSSEDTSVSFPAAGTYQLVLNADDGDLSGSASIIITVEAPPPPPPDNTAPTVIVSGPSSADVGVAIDVAAFVSDDGLPGPYSVLWSATGPGRATFAAPSAERTVVSFDAVGIYEVTLTADDGELAAVASLLVTVVEPVVEPTTEIITGSLNKRWPTRTYSVDTDDGAFVAELVIQTKQPRGKKGSSSAEPSATIVLFDRDGTVLASSTGSGALVIESDVAAGVHSVEVSGGPSSFELRLTYMAP